MIYRKRLKHLIAYGINLGILLFLFEDVFAASETQPSTEATTPQLPLPLQFISNQSLAQALDWVPNPPGSNRLCSGTYQVPKIQYNLTPINPKGGANHNPTEISATQTTLSQTGVSILKGQVLISQLGQELQSELAYIYPKPHTTSFQVASVDLMGQVKIRQKNQVIMGDNAHFDLTNNTGTLFNGIYQMQLGTSTTKLLDVPNQTPLPTPANGVAIWQEPVAWGQANKITQQSKTLYSLDQATYTTCMPTNPSWQFKASSIDLNQQSGRGEAWNSLFYMDSVPIFYFPYFNFPIDARRKTGLLYPTGGYSTSDGFIFSLPVYLNLAPNYDATITPEYMSERGLVLNGDFNYLTDTSKGTFNFGLVPQDQAFKGFQQSAPASYGSSTNPATQQQLSQLESDSDTRGTLSLLDNSTFNSNWTGTVNYTWVSDDYYLNDFGTSLAETTTNQLLQQATLNYTDQHWNFLANVENYQTLHPINQSTVLNSYAELPQFLLTGDYPQLPGGLDFGMEAEYVDFLEQSNPGQLESSAQGSRFNLQPSLSLPLTWGLSGYLTPKIQLQATQYVLYNAGVANPFQPVSPTNPQFTDQYPTRVLPIIDIDTGLFFDRNTELFGHDYTQTLEPRLFYLYVPYENQDDIPVFDTSLQAFDFNQLFQTNRFAGSDRVGDANQVSLALTTRFMDNATGQEKGSASIGDIIYFENRQVTLCRTPGCSDPSYLVGTLPTTTPTSPIAGQLSYNMTPHWNAQANLAWDPNEGETDTANFSVSYKRDNQHVINLGYSFLRNGDIILATPGSTTAVAPSNEDNFNQPYVSFAWPLTERWSAIGYFDYDLSHQYAQQYFGGLQYNSCCYAVRFIASRQFQNLNQYNQPVMQNEYYVQFLLKGLGSVGTANPNSIVSQISGYPDPFGNSLI